MATPIRCNWVVLLALIVLVVSKATAVQVLVLRDNPDSRSAEEVSDSLGAEESDEIDFLVDLLKNEEKDRAPPPVTTVRVIKRKPETRLAAQHSIRKEKVHLGPKGFKEYHVHYHSHQHKEPTKPPYLGFEAGEFKPVLWDSQLPVENYENLKQFQRDPPLPYSESARIKSFRDYESFLKSNLRPSDYSSSHLSLHTSPERPEHEIRIQAVKDFETVIKPKLKVYKTKESTSFDRLKNFQDFIDSDEDQGEFLNQDRFAGFKDFSEIESPPEPKEPFEEKTNSDSAEKKGIKIRDFAIVIKTRPRHSIPNKGNMENTQSNQPRQPDNASPNIPPFVNNYRIPHDKHFSRPRVLEAAGGAPKYIDRVNSLKYPPPDIRHNMPDIRPFRHPIHANALDSGSRFFNMGHWPRHPLQHIPLRNFPNRLFIRRFGK